MWLWGGFSQCTDVSRVKGNVSLDLRSVSQGVSGNQHGEVQAGVSSREKEVLTRQHRRWSFRWLT
jgi:hypothetical protein